MDTPAEAVVQVGQLDNANTAEDARTKFADWQCEALYGRTISGRQPS